MSIQLLVNVLRVPAAGNLASGASVTIAHGLRSNDEAVRPTLIQPDRGTPIVVTAATTTSVTFRNDGPDPTFALFRFERGLSTEVDADTVTPLYWQGAATGGGGGTVTAVTATGPLSSTGGVTPDISLNDSGVVAGNYGDNSVLLSESQFPLFSVSAKGLISSAANGPIRIGGVSAKSYVDTAVSGAVSAAYGLVPAPTGSAVYTTGKAVAISAAGVLILADADTIATSPAVGLYAGGGMIRMAGVQTGLSGLVAGASYYLSTVAGELTASAPAFAGNVVQYIGRAINSTTLFVSPATIVVA